MKNLYADGLKAGSKVEKVPFLVKEENGTYFLTDKKGKVRAKKNQDKLEFFADVVCLISGVVLVEKTELYVHVTQCSVAQESDYNILDFYGALTPEKISDYKRDICSLISNIEHPGYKELVDSCLTDELLDRLGSITVPGDYWGNYRGAPLAATCQIPYMACGAAHSFSKRANGLSHKDINQSLLLTAGLLHEFARGIYVDEADPERKSYVGVTVNYFALLVMELMKVRSSIPDNILSDEDFAMLVNCLEVSVTHSSTRCVSREGKILRSVIAFYREIDAYDWQVLAKPVPEGEGYYFSTEVGCYILEDRKENGSHVS